jgi:hypothetical protein
MKITGWKMLLTLNNIRLLRPMQGRSATRPGCHRTVTRDNTLLRREVFIDSLATRRYEP